MNLQQAFVSRHSSKIYFGQFASLQTKILITSRPDFSLDLHGLANRVEILGFTKALVRYMSQGSTSVRHVATAFDNWVAMEMTVQLIAS